MRNVILVGNVMDVIQQVPDKFINNVSTSPPYWSVRDYGIEGVIWGGNLACEHQWDSEVEPARKWTQGDLPSKNSILGKQVNKHTTSNADQLHGADCYDKTRGASELRPGKSSVFCAECGAWYGQLGLEPSPDLYIDHLCNAFDLIRPKLRDDGTMFVNLGDTYSGSGGAGGDWNHGDRADEPKWHQVRKGSGGKKSSKLQTHDTDNFQAFDPVDFTIDCGPKCLVGIPDRFKLEMIHRGWCIRNDLIWWKRSCMPSSVTDRWTVDYERIFFISKNAGNKLFWINQKTEASTLVQPPGIDDGIEGTDWDWQPCPDCHGSGITTRCDDPDCDSVLLPSKQQRFTLKGLMTIMHWWCEECEMVIEHPVTRPCKKCGETGWTKQSWWDGHDYVFNRQFEPLVNPKVRKGHEFGGKKKGKNAKNGYCNAKYSGNEYDASKLAGRNARAVMDVPVQGFKGKHFATWPPELVRRMIDAGVPRDICRQCGLPRVRIIRAEGGAIGTSWHDHETDATTGNYTRCDHGNGEFDEKADNWHKHGTDGTYQKIISGYSNCGCNAGFVPGIVLDPFLGSGTTA